MIQNELWLNDIDAEMVRADLAKKMGHDGRLRTSARRIAGIALHEYSLTGKSGLSPADDVITMLRRCAVSSIFPSDVRSAAERLQTRVSHEHASPSLDPIGDAMVIVSFVKKHS